VIGKSVQKFDVDVICRSGVIKPGWI